MSAITPEKFYRDLEQILELQPGSIKGDEQLNTIRWDSMAVVIFIATMDEEYSIAIQPSKLAAAETVADLFDLVVS